MRLFETSPNEKNNVREKFDFKDSDEKKYIKRSTQKAAGCVD